MKKLALAAIVALVALLPTAAFAQEGDDEEGAVIMHIRGDVTLAAGERAATVVVIDGNATIEGEVQHNVVVINGNAIVSGTVGENITVVKGNIDLRSGASVNNVFSIRGDLTRAQGATVAGEIRENDNFEVATAVLAAFSILFWLAMSVTVVVAGLIFAAFGGAQLKRAAQAMTGDAVGSILGVVFVWVALPVIAGLAMATLIGIPLGFGLLFFLMPALWFLGYIVAGARLGGWLVGLTGRNGGDHPYAATSLGLILLQLGVLIPAAGLLVAFLAGIWGAGALAASAYRSAFPRAPHPAGPQGTPTLPTVQGTTA